MASIKILDADGVEQTIEVDGDATLAALQATQAAVELLDNTVAGNELQVDVVTMPTVAVTGNFYQATQPVSGTVAVDGVSTSAKQDTIIGHVDGIETLLGTTNSTLTAIDGRVDGLESQIGIVTETAPASDTASSGLNGRLQRIAQRLTSLIALIPTALTGSGNFKVAVNEAVTAGENHIGEVSGNMVRVSTEFTRPADTTAYTAGDVVSNNTSSSTLITLTNAVRVNAGSGYIVRASVSSDKKSITPRIRVHLFNVSDPTVSADNAAYRELYADQSKRLGYFDLPAMLTGTDSTNSDMSRSQDNTIRHPIIAATGTRNIFALLETLDAFTPSSGEKFTLTLTIDNN